MKEIKFRAWDKKRNIMLVGIELKKLLSYLIFQSCPNSDAYEMMKDHFKDIEWLQYTGLKDKNGKEIYEGDIVKMNEGYCEEGKENIDVVIFSEGMFRTKQDWDDCNYCIGDDYLLDGECLIEIIGNIYENPNLLKEIK